jgi:hypothetical protein
MGGIDLDPCTHEAAQERIKATRHYTKADNGLLRAWEGRVWCNPPYGQNIIDLWIEKAATEILAGRVDQLIILLRADTGGNGNGLPLIELCPVVCKLNPRVHFLNDKGEPQTSTNFASEAWYFGGRPKAFRAAFSLYGWFSA